MAVIQKKVCMLGSFGVGKTSLVARFVQGIFSGKYLSTVGVKIDKKSVRVGEQDVLLLLWDLAGEDSRSQVQTSYLKGAAGYFLIVDGTFAESLVTAKSIHKRAVETVGEIPVMLIVNKSDLWGRWEITMPELEKMQAEGWSIQVTSAKTGEGVEKMFMTMTEHILNNGNPASAGATEDDTQP